MLGRERMDRFSIDNLGIKARPEGDNPSKNLNQKFMKGNLAPAIF